jgi:hypothetical protein
VAPAVGGERPGESPAGVEARSEGAHRLITARLARKRLTFVNLAHRMRRAGGEGVHSAMRVSALVRSYGYAHTGVWPALPWTEFKKLVHALRA